MSNNKLQCAACRSIDEPQFQCLLKTKGGSKYCALHSDLSKVRDYITPIHEVGQYGRPLVVDKITVKNDIIKKLLVDEKKPLTLNKQVKIESNKSKKTMVENNVNNVQKCIIENEEDLQVKLLILINDDEYSNSIPELIGPVFNDPTISEDQQDPVTLDEFWTLENGKRVPVTGINRYYLFSYCDSKGKIRCFSIFTIYGMIKEQNFVHPITLEEISADAIQRAKKLVDLYQKKLSLFNKSESEWTPEFALRQRLSKFFKKFHIHSIYLEEDWLLNLDDRNKLDKIIVETEKLISSNLKSINPTLKNLPLFNNRFAKKKNSSQENILEIHTYIVSQWEKLIAAADTPQNQLPIWILVTGLSFVVPEIKTKYPTLEMMLN